MMRFLTKFFKLLDAATGDGGEGGGGAGGDPAAAAAAAAATGGDGGTGGDGSALGTGGEAAPAWTVESIPEKYRVKKEDGTIDAEASLQKVDQARSHLEKRMGSGDVPPKEFSEYKVPDLPEELKGVELSTEEFAKKAHGMGLTQKQYEGVMSEYFSLLPNLVAADSQAQTGEVVSQLRETWGEASDANFRNAHKAAVSIGESIGIPYAEIEKAIGNNPVALRLLAAVGGEMSEDKTPPNANGAVPAGFDINVAMSSKAYQNANDPEHEKVTAQVNAHYAKLEKAGKL
ncbi:hypothetical protein [Herbaspirillum autotrophicum]|uniref:hypothetical protein n=1 Tax=Herbaspirillum autotrophicum TaxID=180195 RepID=UPI0018DD953F|nr:hypothetical protein [Herbaspirillum autotrophicum]